MTMKNNNLLKSFVKESGSVLLIVKKNNLKYYLSIVLVVSSVIVSLRCLYAFENFHIEKNRFNFFLWLLVTFLLPCLLYFEYYKSQKEQFLILHHNDTANEFCFWLKKENRNQVKIIMIDELEIVSVTSKGDDEIILLSNGKLPWGNRKIVISDEFKDRKEEVLEFLKLILKK